MRAHKEKVATIISQIKALNANASGQKFVSLRKKSVSHMVPKPSDPKHKDRKVQISDLNKILEIDPQNKTGTVEPGVTFCDLVPETLKYGLIPCLVPELKTITCGGAVSGCSVESMSYKFGGFHDTCLEYEIVTGTGDVLICSPEKNSEIFHMLHGSYGTLGIITKIKFKLITAKSFVKMNYKLFPTFSDFQKALLEHMNRKDFDFIDGIVHGKNKFVLCLGHMIDSAPYTSSYNYLNIFYKSTLNRKEDYLATYDYLFRYDADCHWLTKTLPGMETKLMRLFFGKLLLSSTHLLTWSKRLSFILKYKKNPDVILDVFIPYYQFENFYRRYEKEINFYPLWIVPYRVPHRYPWIAKEHADRMRDPFFIDCAVYGKKHDRSGVNYYKTLEDLTYDCGGLKALIAYNFYTRDTFWKIYNKENYTKVKKITDPDGLFRDLYEKLHPALY